MKVMNKILLTHFQPIFYSYILTENIRNRSFSNVFMGYRSGTLAENGLIHGKGMVVEFIYVSKYS